MRRVTKANAMFGAIRYNATTKGYEHVELTTADSVDARGFTRNACDTCRARKLKCSGERDCCERCHATSNNCTYTLNSTPGGGRKTYPCQVPDSGMAANRIESYSGPGVQNAEPRPSLTDARSRREQPTKKGRRVTRSQIQGGTQSALMSPTATDSVLEKDSSMLATVNVVDRTPSSTTVASGSPALTSFLISPDEPILDALFMTPEGLSQHEVDGEALYQSMFTDGSQLPFPWALANTDWTSSPISAQQSVSAPSPLPLPHQLQDYTTDLGRPNIRNIPRDHQPMQGHESLPPSHTLNTPSSSQGTYLRPNTEEVCCNCISDMAQLLEDTGAQQGSASMAAGVDTLLIHLYRGVNTCTNVLQCTRCNTCSGNSMLVATTTQQLGALSADVGAQLMEHQLRRETANVSGPSSNNSPGADVLFGNVSFGRYHIETTEMRLQLVQSAILMHLVNLRAVLGHIKRRIGPEREAWKLLVDAEDKIAKTCWMIEQLSNRVRSYR